MVVLFNFVPVEFGGGAERWMMDVGDEIAKKEEVWIISVPFWFANIYGKLVLGRSFPNRQNTKNFSYKRMYLEIGNCVAFIKLLKNARIVYSKCEILEILAIFFGGGFLRMNKWIIGVQSPFLYKYPSGFFDKLHNFVYSSIVVKSFLKSISGIHVLTLEMKLQMFQMGIRRVIEIPNYSEHIGVWKEKKSKNLRVAFVGELTHRKGIDVLIAVAEMSNPDIGFFVIGDGPELEKVKNAKNIEYLGRMEHKKVLEFMSTCDVLFLPSRGEGLAFVMLEAMSMGLVLVTTPAAAVGLPFESEYVHEPSDIQEFVKNFEDLVLQKNNGRLVLNSKNTRKLFERSYTKEVIMPRILREIFKI